MLRKKRTGRFTDTAFPPKPLSRRDADIIIRKHCRTMRPAAFVESGCAVCGCLVSGKLVTPLSKYEGILALLIRAGVTRNERSSSTDPIEELEGPVLASIYELSAKLF